jgi:hypothetical protein
MESVLAGGTEPSDTSRATTGQQNPGSLVLFRDFPGDGIEIMGVWQFWLESFKKINFLNLSHGSFLTLSTLNLRPNYTHGRTS